MVRRKTALARLLEERILYGGLLTTRARAYSHAYHAAFSRGLGDSDARKAADYFAFHPEPVTDEDIARWRAELPAMLVMGETGEAEIVSWEEFDGVLR